MIGYKYKKALATLRESCFHDEENDLKSILVVRVFMLVANEENAYMSPIKVK